MEEPRTLGVPEPREMCVLRKEWSNIKCYRGAEWENGRVSVGIPRLGVPADCGRAVCIDSGGPKPYWQGELCGGMEPSF